MGGSRRAEEVVIASGKPALMVVQTQRGDSCLSVLLDIDVTLPRFLECWRSGGCSMTFSQGGVN